ncbi:MAG: hypothetical protein AB7U48_10085 [Bauldia sp.]
MIRVLSLALVVLLAACATTPEEVSTTPPAAGAEGGVVLEAIEGAPESVTGILTAAFNSTAAGRGLRANEAGAGYTFHGYFSVVGSTAGTLLIYVWDVESADGSRVTRISGQISSTLAAADPWQVVEANMVVQAISDTFDDFQTWQAGAGV